MLEQEMTAPETCGWHASEACRRHVRRCPSLTFCGEHCNNLSYHTTLLTRGIDANANRKDRVEYCALSHQSHTGHAV